MKTTSKNSPDTPSNQRFIWLKTGLDEYKTLLGSIQRITKSLVIWSFLGSLIFFVIVVLSGLLDWTLGLVLAEVEVFLIKNYLKILAVVWVGFQTWKVEREAGKDREFFVRVWCTFLTSLLVLFMVAFGSLVLYVKCVSPIETLEEVERWGFCEETTSTFGGGWREFQGQKYKIQICEKDVSKREWLRFWIYAPNTRKRIQIDVFNEQGILQATERLTGKGGSFYVHVKENLIEVGDHANSNNRIIKMPPSRLEWLRARIPSIRQDFFGE